MLAKPPEPAHGATSLIFPQPQDPALQPPGEKEALSKQHILHGRYVTLEPLRAAAAQELWSLACGFPDSWRFLPVGPFDCFAQFRIYAGLLENSPGETVWCLRPRTGGKPGAAAGWIALLDTAADHGAIELGNVWFPPPFTGTRAATEAKMLLLGHAFETLRVAKVVWKSHANNHESRRAAERLGFRYEGLSKADMIAQYGMAATLWPARRAALRHWLAPDNFDPSGRQKQALARAA